MSKPLNARRTELRLPCDKPEPPRVVLERLPPRKPQTLLGRVNYGLGVVAVVLVSLLALGWLLKRL